MIKKCKDCEWAGPFGTSSIIPFGLKPNTAPKFMQWLFDAICNYILIYYTKKRCCDCSMSKPCTGNPAYSGLVHWGYCANYKRKMWKFWRPK